MWKKLTFEIFASIGSRILYDNNGLNQGYNRPVVIDKHRVLLGGGGSLVVLYGPFDIFWSKTACTVLMCRQAITPLETITNVKILKKE